MLECNRKGKSTNIVSQTMSVHVCTCVCMRARVSVCLCTGSGGEMCVVLLVVN